MLDDLFISDNLRTLQDAAMRPPPVPKQAADLSAWRIVKAVPRAMNAGIVQAGSGMADVLGAFGETLGATGTASSRGMYSTPTADERQQADAAAKKLREQGASFDLGDPGRRFADEFKPDPETAHDAERVVFEVIRVMTKGAGYVATGGAIPGAAMTGFDEALTTADDLKQQGVDLATRTKVGAVVGGVTALSVGLPMAGNTLAQTAGLVALGGPVSFMAQQQAVRSILNAADYSKLAEQYDPLDPVGLAVSTLIPVGFGAWGLRAAKARQAREATEAAARAEADFAAGPVPSERTAVADAVRAVTDEQVDAARVMLAVERRQAGNPFRADDWRAHDAHEQALVRAADQMARGERVAVGDALPSIIETPEARAARTEIEALQQEREQLLPVADQLAERGAIRTARQELAAMEQERPNISDEAARDLAKQIQAKDRVSYKAALAEARKQLEGSQADFLARQQRLNDAIDTNATAQRATQRLGDIERRISELEAQLPAESRLPRFAQQLQALSRQTNPTQEPPRAPTTTPRATPEATPTAAKPPPTDARGPGPEQQPAGPDATTRATTSAEARLVDDATARQADALMAEQPDMLVMLDGMDEPRRLSEVLADIKAEADEMRLDGELLQVAAQCALQHGA